MKNHTRLYTAAEAYDIAFDFRDLNAECDFLLQLSKKFLGKKAGTFLELAAGPAATAIEMAKRGLNSTSIDLSSNMVKYGLKKAKDAKVNIDYICTNMTNFSINKNFDLAATLMDSISYIHTNEEFVNHLQCVANCLNEGGLYIIEALHPKDVFNVEKSTNTSWEMQREGKKVKIIFGKSDDFFDPITGISNTSVSLEFWQDEIYERIEDVALQRKYTFNELDALIKLSKRLKIIDTYGSLNTAIPFDNSKNAWRMVLVLQK